MTVAESDGWRVGTSVGASVELLTRRTGSWFFVPGYGLDFSVPVHVGPGGSVDPAYGSRRMRLCFGHPSADTIREGVGVLAEVVAAETGLQLP